MFIKKREEREEWEFWANEIIGALMISAGAVTANYWHISRWLAALDIVQSQLDN